MSLALAERAEPGVEVDERLARLAEGANREHRGVEEGLATALRSAIRCGEILLQAREIVNADGKGLWGEWVAKNCVFSAANASVYLRLAFHKESIPAELFTAGPRADLRTQGSINQARIYLRGLPGLTKHGSRIQTPEKRAARAEIKRLHGQGISHSQIAALVGVSRTFVTGVVNPEAAKARRVKEVEKRRRIRAAAVALREKEAREAALRLSREVGGSLEETYSLIRKAQQKADSATAQVKGREVRRALLRVIRSLEAAEDSVNDAIKEAAISS